jgi:hypothetical protein
MKRLMLASLLGSLAFAAAAQDTTTDAAVDTRTPVEQTDAAPPADARGSVETTVERDARRDCMRYTGSRILARRSERNAPPADAEAVGELDRDECISANGRIYSRDDLMRTGETDIADALRRLDPAIR